MAYNLLNTELLKQYSGTFTSMYGEWVLRNGVWAMRLGPGPIYYSQSDHIGLKNGEFKANTRYLIDLWIDTDDIYWTDGSRQVPGGLSFYYADGGFLEPISYGDITNPKGFQHVRVISEANRTIKGVHPYNFIGVPAFYRYDSSITEYVETNVEKTGIIETGIIKENYSITDTLLYKGGVVATTEIKEI